MDKMIYYVKDFFGDFLASLVKMLLPIIAFITIMLVVIEILKVLKVLDFLNRILYVLTKPLGISKSASMPLLIGILAGITYGAGAILASYANNEMTKKDVLLVSIFLCACHGMIEDTWLFASIGAKGWLLVLIRFLIAIVATIITNIIINLKKDVNLVNN